MPSEEIISTLLVVCPLVFLGCLIDAVAGGGGLITLPAYLIAGLPPHAASATNKCSSSFGSLFAIIPFIKRRQFHGGIALVSAPIALFGAWLGVKVNLILPDQFLYYVMLVVVPVLAIFLTVKKDLGDVSGCDQIPKKKLLLTASIIGLVMGFYDGFFGPGTGTFLMIALTMFCKLDLLTASGNTKVINTCSNISSFVSFALAGEVLWQIGIPAGVFGLVGGLTGSAIAMRGGGKVIRPMFKVVLSLMIIRLIYDLLM